MSTFIDSVAALSKGVVALVLGLASIPTGVLKVTADHVDGFVTDLKAKVA